MSHQAFLLNRVWVVINNDTHEQVGEAFVSKQEADRFILELWKEDRPAVSEQVSFDPSGDVTEDLLDILDKMHGDLGLWIRAAA